MRALLSRSRWRVTRGGRFSFASFRCARLYVYIHIFLSILYISRRKKMYIARWHYVPIHYIHDDTGVFVNTHRQKESNVASFDLCTYVYVYIYYTTVFYVLALGDSARRRRWEDRKKERGQRDRGGNSGT